MANSVLKNTTLKMVYDFGMVGEKKVVKTKSISGIKTTATDEQLLAVANAIFAVQTNEGTLIQMLEPLVKNRCRHYFGVCDEDMLQLGNIRLVELIRAFDHTRCDNRFVGYADRMISCYYWNLKNRKSEKQKS